ATAPPPSLPYSGPRPTNRKSHSGWTTKRVPLTLLPCVDQTEYGGDNPEHQSGDKEGLNGCRHRNMISDKVAEHHLSI
ncbi:hypothetical protein AB0876_27700, partial [Mycobacterium sp. NPDC049093]